MEAELRAAARRDVSETDAQLLLQRLQLVEEEDLSPLGAFRPPPSALQDDTAGQVRASRRIIERTLAVLERVEPSVLEHQLNEMQLLEMAVLQRNQLVPPRSLVRDHWAYSALPSHCCSPQAVRAPHVTHLIERVVETGVWTLCRDPFFKNGKQNLYLHEPTQIMQTGEPFDYTMKKSRSSLMQENW